MEKSIAGLIKQMIHTMIVFSLMVVINCFIFYIIAYIFTDYGLTLKIMADVVSPGVSYSLLTSYLVFTLMLGINIKRNKPINDLQMIDQKPIDLVIALIAFSYFFKESLFSMDGYSTDYFYDNLSQFFVILLIFVVSRWLTSLLLNIYVERIDDNIKSDIDEDAN